MFGGTRRYYRDITKHILVLRNLSLYSSTCKYYKTYTGTSYLILVLRSISWSYGTYTYITELILVFQILYLSYRAYTRLTDLILVLHNLFLSYGSYTCFTEYVLVFQILYLYYRTCTCISDKEVLVGTIEHFTCTKVPVGTPEQIQRYP